MKNILLCFPAPFEMCGIITNLIKNTKGLYAPLTVEIMNTFSVTIFNFMIKCSFFYQSRLFLSCLVIIQ